MYDKSFALFLNTIDFFVNKCYNFITANYDIFCFKESATNEKNH